MANLTTFAANPDSERFEKSMQSTGAVGIKSLYLSDKGIPKAPFYDKLEGATQNYISNNTNTESDLWLTYGGASPAISFIGEWVSVSSHVLAFFKMGEEASSWISLDTAPKTVYTSDTVYETALSQTKTIPKAVREGDTMLLACFTRDVAVIDPSWTEVDSINISDVSYTQHMYLFKKQATTADIEGTVEVSQSAEDRIATNLSVWRHPDGVQISAASTSQGYANNGGIDSPIIAPSQKDSVIFSVASSVYANLLPPNYLVADNGWTQITPRTSDDTQDQIRLGVAYKYGNETNTERCYWLQNSGMDDPDSCGNIMVTIEKAP